MWSFLECVKLVTKTQLFCPRLIFFDKWMAIANIYAYFRTIPDSSANSDYNSRGSTPVRDSDGYDSYNKNRIAAISREVFDNDEFKQANAKVNPGDKPETRRKHLEWQQVWSKGEPMKDRDYEKFPNANPFRFSEDLWIIHLCSNRIILHLFKKKKLAFYEQICSIENYFSTLKVFGTSLQNYISLTLQIKEQATSKVSFQAQEQAHDNVELYGHVFENWRMSQCFRG